MKQANAMFALSSSDYAAMGLTTAQVVAMKAMSRTDTGTAIYQNHNKLILTPYMSLIFRGVNFRTFSFEFKFTPKNEKESTEIYNIWKEFRKAQHPKHINAAFRGYPKEVEISYIHSGSGGLPSQQNHWLNKFKKCVINDVSLNYTSAGFYSPMRDGFPGATTMNITFTENETLVRQDIEEGY
jgi:hypothetical protein